MRKKECVAMILAGGQGTRLGVLTRKNAKPAVPFGGKYRIIDFTLSNCAHSGIDTVGVLTQYQPLELNTYIGSGQWWDLDRNDGGVYVLPPYTDEEKGEWYKGTANAIYQNISFVDQFSPELVLILSGDHIYKMDYSKMIESHKKSGASATISVLPVPIEDAPRFGIMNVNDDNIIVEFDEKPAIPKSNLASMGVYVFNWETLKRYLLVDENNAKSRNDFGKNIIPSMLAAGERMFAYSFDGYWKDVGTLQSLWEANMDLLSARPSFNIADENWKIYSRNPSQPPHFISSQGSATNSYVTEGCEIHGIVENSILFAGVIVREGAIIKDSIVMPGCIISKDVTVQKSIIGSGAKLLEGSYIGDPSEQSGRYYSEMCTNDITVVGPNVIIDTGVSIGKNCMIDQDIGGHHDIEIDIEKETEEAKEEMLIG